MSAADECTCDLIDVSTYADPRFVRGFSNGCPIHPPSEYERKVMAERARRAALIEAAMREARERP